MWLGFWDRGEHFLYWCFRQWHFVIGVLSRDCHHWVITSRTLFFLQILVSLLWWVNISLIIECYDEKQYFHLSISNLDWRFCYALLMGKCTACMDWSAMPGCIRFVLDQRQIGHVAGRLVSLCMDINLTTSLSNLYISICKFIREKYDMSKSARQIWNEGNIYSSRLNVSQVYFVGPIQLYLFWSLNALSWFFNVLHVCC